MKHNTSVSSVYHPSETALPALNLTQCLHIDTQLWWETELLVIGSKADPDSRKMEPPPAALRDELAGT